MILAMTCRGGREANSNKSFEKSDNGKIDILLDYQEAVGEYLILKSITIWTA